MFGKSAFGSGGGFGQQPQQTSVFGQQPQQQSAFGGFGASSTPSTTFGSTATTGTSAFGQPAQTSAFGSTGTTGGFGTGTSAFGQSRPSAFGGTSTFSSAQPSTGFGGFGSTTSAPSAFGSTTTQTGGGLFGQNRPSAFGTAATSTPSAFGSTTGTSAFGQGQQQQSAFGMGTTTSAFGQPAAGAGQGTAIADFTATQDRDIASGVNNFFQTITAMPQYRNYSLEELRLQDYAQNRKTSAAAAPGGFGTATTGGFGSTATSTPFGQTGTSAFGQQAGTSAFGQPQTSSAFGSTGTGTGLFGQQQQPSTGTSAFGSGTTGFGSTGGGFGSSTGTSGFGSTGTGAFGSAASNAAKPLFGSTQPSTGGFGTSTTPAFGQQTSGTTAFGQTNQQQTGFGGFGQKPAGTTGGFGTGGGFGGFGSTATSKPTTSFSFGTTGQTGTTGTTGFGGGFGSTGTGTTGFGQTQTSQPSSLFGANKPAGTGTSLFGNATQQTTGTGGFGFGTGQTGTTGFGGTGGGLFGSKPATGTGTSGGLFGNTQTGTTGFGGFGTQHGGSTFNLPATGGLTSFGTSSQPQQPLIATVDQNPYGKNPLFESTKPGVTLGGKSEPSAVPIEGGDKKPLAPHYPISPRVVSKIKLRGFSFSPSPKPGAKRMSSLEGISDDAVLAAGAYMPRSSNKKLIFDKDISSKEVTFLANKKEGRSKALFDPKLELIAAYKDVHPKGSQQSTIQGSSTTSATSNIGPTSSPSAAFSAVSSKSGYYSSPTLDALLSMSKDELKHVENFVVGRNGYGEVRFEEPVDLSEVNLHEIMGELIVIEHRKLVVYPKEERKTPQGVEMNKPATITINGCFPEDKDTNQEIRDPNHPRLKAYEEKLKNRKNTEFISYDVKTGDWKFKVKHF